MSEPITYEEALLSDAQAGTVKLKKRERRQLVLHLLRTGKLDDYKERDLAALLGCSVRQVKELKQHALDVLCSKISADEALNIMALYVRDFDILIAEAMAGLRDPSVQKGTGAHQAYLRIAGELIDSKVAKLQSIGIIPKELGRLTSVKEEWEATVSVDGVVDVQRTDDRPTPPAQDE